MILRKNDTVVFETRSKDEATIVATGIFIRSLGIWVKYKVENLPCLAIVDTGASTSLINRHLASTVRKHVSTHPNRLLDPIGDAIPIDGKQTDEVTFGKHKITDEFIAKDELYPHVLIGLKFLSDNKFQVDIENETPEITIKNQAERQSRYT